ncbi:MAG: YeeE/YedE family protein [Candidatus Binatus sp.]|uniref:YeeE/YedE family protein n=1 Tax=Candidatus Binatus sp. TaxID=2811406 RepID=UPI0027283A15|nr:YeeE/YedE family protein [Candidatus Binatus sp.]MDO8432819.1 YeeE/YedE family protein [Candidatus Binatus sp.]
MKKYLVSLASGVVFALGLGISGMTRPSKVIGFLDFAGDWDPSLGLVMAGAMGVYAIAYQASRRMGAPLLSTSFAIPAQSNLDGRLIAGAALFGIGWGLGGFCPGPAITSMASGQAPVFVFVIAMAAGMILQAVVMTREKDQAYQRLSHPAADS